MPKPTQKRGPGRPGIGAGSTSLTLAVVRTDIECAEGLLDDFERAFGVCTNRADILRAAITRGLAAIKSDIAARAK